MKSFLEDRPEPWQGHALAECSVAALPQMWCHLWQALQIRTSFGTCIWRPMYWTQMRGGVPGRLSIVSLIKDTACCDQATESVWVWLSGVTADNPAISHKPWSEVYRYHRVHAAITSCLWNASFSYKARSAHPWQVYMGSNLSRKQSSSLQCSALLMSPAIARQLECLLHHWHYTIFICCYTGMTCPDN